LSIIYKLTVSEIPIVRQALSIPQVLTICAAMIGSKKKTLLALLAWLALEAGSVATKLALEAGESQRSTRIVFADDESTPAQAQPSPPTFFEEIAQPSPKRPTTSNKKRDSSDVRRKPKQPASVEARSPIRPASAVETPQARVAPIVSSQDVPALLELHRPSHGSPLPNPLELGQQSMDELPLVRPMGPPTGPLVANQPKRPATPIVSNETISTSDLFSAPSLDPLSPRIAAPATQSVPPTYVASAGAPGVSQDPRRVALAAHASDELALQGPSLSTDQMHAEGNPFVDEPEPPGQSPVLSAPNPGMEVYPSERVDLFGESLPRKTVQQDTTEDFSAHCRETLQQHGLTEVGFEECESILPGIPRVIGGMLQGGTRRLTFQSPQLAGDWGATHRLPIAGGGVGVRQFSIAQNNSPVPRDRVYLDYGFFNDIPGGIQDASRYTLGFEKQHLGGLASWELRIPFTSSVDHDQIVPSIDAQQRSHFEFGNLLAVWKGLFYYTDDSAWTAGLGVSIPTANDVQWSLANGQRIAQVRNDAVHLLPYVAVSHHWGLRGFAQTFAQFDFDVNGNAVYGNSPDSTIPGFPMIGRINDPSMFSSSTSIGYWLYENDAAMWLSGLAMVTEFHYASTLQSADIVSGNGLTLTENSRRTDILNLTVGTQMRVRTQGQVGIGVAIPLNSGDDQQFDYQVLVQANRSF
jgi:hypothetical protein